MQAYLIFICWLFGLIATQSWAAFDSPQTPLTFTNQTNQFVPVNQAFPFNHTQRSNQLNLDWQIKAGYYLYQDRLKITGQGIKIESDIPPGTPYHDAFFGNVNIYTDPLFIVVNLKDAQAKATITVEYQGCAKAGFCYPPEKRVIPIAPIDAHSQQENNVESKVTLATKKTSHERYRSEQQQLADSLATKTWALALFFLLGIGLAFTPCVLPMYPIITSIVLGTKQLTKARALWLSFLYVQGMAVTYSLLGLVVASAGIQFQALLQSPSVLIIISLLFVALSLSMFGVYTLQIPSSIQTKLSNWSAKQSSGQTISVFIMGAISGLICSPCTTAPLSGALLYVAQSGDLVKGASALYLLSLGMGIPLIAVSVFGQHALPKSGMWMDKVKISFGFVLLAAPIFLLERITSPMLSATLWSLLGLSAFGWLYWQKNRLPFGGWKQTSLGIIAVLGMIASVKPLLTFMPDNILSLESAVSLQTNEMNRPSSVTFKRVLTIQDLEQELNYAKQHRQPVMLDIYADWCVACKEFEHITFTDKRVKEALNHYHLIQADVTQNQERDVQLLQKLDVLGLPTLVFWDAMGNQINEARITGFMDAPTFLHHIRHPQLTAPPTK
jgi:thioredoxin:protein disulfide reductase